MTYIDENQGYSEIVYEEKYKEKTILLSTN